MPIESNIDAVDQAFQAAIQTFGFSSPSHTGGTVGERIAKVLGDAIHDRGIQFLGVEGRWQDNADSTIRSKGFNAPNYETGEMLSNVIGEVKSTRNECIITAGTNDEVKKKIYYAHAGQSRKEIQRPLFGATQGDVAPLLLVMRDEIASHFGARG